MDIIPDHVLHPDRTKVLSTETLQQAIPDFDWTGGHSGQLLRPDQAERLEALWEDFLEENYDVTEKFEFDDEEEVEAFHSQEYATSVEHAIGIVADAFEGRLDLDGRPMVFHSLAVGMAGQTREEQICGLLHDLVGDTDWTFSDLMWHGVNHNIIRALQLLIHEEGIDYFDYVRRIAASGNLLAITVKRNILQHYLSHSRVNNHPKLLQRYKQSLEILNESKFQLQVQ